MLHLFPPLLHFSPFQCLLSKPVLIWNKSQGSVKHQVVDWGSFSSNRWLRHFMTNGHGTIASQTIFQLLLHKTQQQPIWGAPTAAHRSWGVPTTPAGQQQEPPARSPGGLYPGNPRGALGEIPTLSTSGKKLRRHRV